MNTEHLNTASALDLRCKHCGGSQFVMPFMSLERLQDNVRGFLLMHRRCEKPTEPSKQVELFDKLAAKEANHTGVIQVGGESTIAPANKELPIICVRCNEQVLAGDALTHYEGCKPMVPERDVFAEMYPMAQTRAQLWDELRTFALQPEQVKQLGFDGWQVPPDGPAFDELAHWSRCSKARSERQAAKQRGEPSIDGLYVPAVPPMPQVLRDALGKLAPKQKRGARPLANPGNKRGAK